MNPARDFLISIGVALVALLPIVNPFSTAVLLLTISTHLTPSERNRQTTRACIYMAGIRPRNRSARPTGKKRC